jgi:hypothetical protein
LPEDPALPFRALHALRIKGVATADAVATLAEQEAAECQEALARLRAEGAVGHREGPYGAWRLTAAGRSLHGSLLARERHCWSRTTQEGLFGGYAGFPALNATLKQLCTDWQLRSRSAPNDHRDAGYDAAVLSRLASFHDEASALCTRLGEALSRLRVHGQRLDQAMDRVRAGDLDALVKPLHPSYHDIWMELHQDLLLSLALARTEADA